MFTWICYPYVKNKREICSITGLKWSTWALTQWCCCKMCAYAWGSDIWINANRDSASSRPFGLSWHLHYRNAVCFGRHEPKHSAYDFDWSIWQYSMQSLLCLLEIFSFRHGSDLTHSTCAILTCKSTGFHLSCIFLMLYSIKKRYMYIIPFIVYFKWVLMTGFFLLWICSWPSAVPGIFFSKPCTWNCQQSSLKNAPPINIYQFLKYTCVESTFRCTTGVEFLVVLF